MNLASKLRKLVGGDAVADDEQTLAEHGGDKWFAHESPEVVVFARSTDDASRLLRFANENKIPVTARGAGYG
jgi:FAD/FMN-containing dehydrogenase